LTPEGRVSNLTAASGDLDDREVISCSKALVGRWRISGPTDIPIGLTFDLRPADAVAPGG
jgi:hypothetical protein